MVSSTTPISGTVVYGKKFYQKWTSTTNGHQQQQQPKRRAAPRHQSPSSLTASPMAIAPKIETTHALPITNLPTITAIYPPPQRAVNHGIAEHSQTTPATTHTHPGH